jgi:predicted AlkP superfamily phosphohydrolase/phosphomutase
MTNPRVWVLGLDGATLDLIKPWADEGHLPVLGRLMGEGVAGGLRSTYPPLTGPAWSSFMTGKSPGRHGVLEFFRREPGTYRQVLNSQLTLDGKSLWRLLSDRGVQVGVMGVPLTYPPEDVNGFLITGLLTPAGRRDFTCPPALLNEMEAHLGEYRLRHDEKYRRNNPEPFIQEQYEILKNNTQAALYLMRNKPWEFFMVHILGTDRIQHEFWHLLDPSHPQHDPAERARYGNVILDFFKAVDASVGQLLGALDDDVIVMVMSDHGFGPVRKFVNFNTWLMKEGLLRLKSNPKTWFRKALFHLGINYATAAQWVLKLGLGRQAKEMGRARREDLQRRLFLSLDDVDWDRTKVFSMGNFGQLYVNLEGREPLGCVPAGAEYEELLDDLTGRLEAMTDPETGERVIGQIYRREDVYDGAYAAQAPDLMFLTRDMEYKAMGLSDFSSNRVFDPVYGTTGHHRMNGVLICRGPGVVEGVERLEDVLEGGAGIHDLAPTILYALGQPIPREMDGRVLLDLFTPEFREQRSVVYTEPAEGGADGADGQAGGSAYSEQEEAEMRDMLQALGYVT